MRDTLLIAQTMNVIIFKMFDLVCFPNVEWNFALNSSRILNNDYVSAFFYRIFIKILSGRLSRLVNIIVCSAEHIYIIVNSLHHLPQFLQWPLKERFSALKPHESHWTLSFWHQNEIMMNHSLFQLVSMA